METLIVEYTKIGPWPGLHVYGYVKNHLGEMVRLQFFGLKSPPDKPFEEVYIWGMKDPADGKIKYYYFPGGTGLENNSPKRTFPSRLIYSGSDKVNTFISKWKKNVDNYLNWQANKEGTKRKEHDELPFLKTYQLKNIKDLTEKMSILKEAGLTEEIINQSSDVSPQLKKIYIAALRGEPIDLGGDVQTGEDELAAAFGLGKKFDFPLPKTPKEQAHLDLQTSYKGRPPALEGMPAPGDKVIFPIVVKVMGAKVTLTNQKQLDALRDCTSYTDLLRFRWKMSSGELG